MKQWLTLVTILQVVRIIDGQIFSNKQVEGVYQFGPLDLREPTGHVVGQAIAKVTVTVYTLLDVVYIDNDGGQFNDIGGDNNWKVIADLNFADDCNDDQLKKYPSFRKLFCIEKSNGKVKTTKYFEHNTQTVGVKYILTIKVRNGNQNYPESSFSVEIVSKCTELIPLLAHLSQCSLEALFSDAPLPVKNRKTYPIFLTVLKLEISTTVENNLNSKAKIKIKLLVDERPKTTLEFVYFEDVKNYYVPLDPPIIIQPSAVISARISFREKSLNDNFKVHTLYYLIKGAENPTDYCSRTQCTSDAIALQEKQRELVDYCPGVDSTGRIGAYAFCSDNKSPIQTKTEGQFDWDEMRKTGNPVSAISNYATDPENRALIYEVVQVEPLYSLLDAGLVVDVSDDSSDCKYAADNKVPNVFVCVNDGTGNMLATTQLFNRITVDEVLNVTVRVFDTEVYPPRMLETHLKIYAQSECTDSYSAYRSLPSYCNWDYITHSIANGKIDKVYRENYAYALMKANNANLDVSIHVDDQEVVNGEFINSNLFTLQNPLRIALDKEYTVKSQAENSFTVLLLENEDYCTAASGECKVHYNEYTTLINKVKDKCPDIDLFGMRAKYAFCKDNTQPGEIKNAYEIDLNSEYALKEVIPRSSAMYADHESLLKYKLIAVDNENKTNTNTNPKCTSKSIGYFCINENTGKIYTTNSIAGQLTSISEFTLTVNVIADAKFPMRKRDIDIKLTAKDNCPSVTSIYKKLPECVTYKELNTDSNGVFVLPNNLRYVTAAVLSFDNESNAGRELSFHFLITFKDDKTKFYPEIKTTIKGAKISIPIDFYSPDIVKIELNFEDNILPDKVVLRYIEKFSCSKECIDRFAKWKSTADTVLKDEGVNCTNDVMNYGSVFQMCSEPAVEFVTLPHISPQVINSDDKVTISGAVYRSPFAFATAYWMKDSRRISGVEVTSEEVSPWNFRLSALTITKASYTSQGSYQVVIENVGVRKETPLVSLQLNDVSCATVITDVSSEVWKDGLSDENTDEYKSMKQELQFLVKTTFEEDNPQDNVVAELQEFRQSAVGVIAVLKMFILKVTESNRLQNCKKLAKYEVPTRQGSFKIESTKITSCDCCLEETVGSVDFTGAYKYETTLLNETVTQKCTYDKSKTIRRQCVAKVSGAEWAEVDLKACPAKTATSQKLISLDTSTIFSSETQNMSKELEETVVGGNLTSEYDVKLVADVIESIITADNSTEEVTDSVLGSVDAILEKSEDLMKEADRQFDSSSLFIAQLGRLARQQKKGISIKKKNLGFTAVIKTVPSDPVFIFSNRTNSALNNETSVDIWFEERPEDTANMQAYIYLPSQIVKKDDKVFSYAFKKKSFFTSLSTNTTLDSLVLSATIENKEVHNSNQLIEMMFERGSTPSDVEGEEEKRQCGWYKESVNGSEPVWTTENCTTTNNGTKFVKCTCNHLTNFALILDVSQTAHNPLALQIVTWIGCGVSMAGLLLTLLTYGLFSNLRKKLAPKILINLCLSLLLTLILFLALAEQTSNRSLCQAAAGLIQFFVLASFCWMAVEGLNLYRMFVKVFRGSSSSRAFMIKASVFAYGIPLIFTIGTGAIKPDSLGDDKICVVRGTPFYFGVLLPVCVVYAGNIIVLILVLRGITGGSKLTKDSKSTKSNKFAQVRITLACATLLGTTWIFAMLAVGGMRDFFQWLFCIFNSLQGLFIFIFYTLRNAEVRKHWFMLFGGKGFHPQPSHSLSRLSTHTKSSSDKPNKFERSSTEMVIVKD